MCGRKTRILGYKFLRFHSRPVSYSTPVRLNPNTTYFFGFWTIQNIIHRYCHGNPLISKHVSGQSETLNTPPFLPCRMNVVIVMVIVMVMKKTAKYELTPHCLLAGAPSLWWHPDDSNAVTVSPKMGPNMGENSIYCLEPKKIANDECVNFQIVTLGDILS